MVGQRLGQVQDQKWDDEENRDTESMVGQGMSYEHLKTKAAILNLTPKTMEVR